MKIAIVEAHVVGIYIVNVQVAVGMVVAIRLVVSGISQPPSAAVGGAPRTLLSDVLLHSVVHDGPVVLVARRPDLHAGWTGMFVATSADGAPVIDSYNSASRVAGCRDS